MSEIALTLTLEEPTVFSAEARTEGQHASLDYIPGSALHGALAAALYRNARLDQARRFELLHSGRVRIGDGLPLHGGEVGWPMPRCWYHPKTELFQRDGRLLAAHITNRQWVQDEDAAQPKQLRSGYVTASGAYLNLRHAPTLKTAINAATGRAADSQLFAYDALQAGQRFVARVQWDDDLSEAEALLREALDGELLLGRSRSAEFGRAAVAWGEAPPRPASAQAAPDGVTLWLTADMALLERYGLPTLTPEPGHFGLDSGHLDWKRSFLQTRRYAPYNAYRGVRDEDRVVIVRGSVIHFSGVDAGAAATLAERAPAGFGLYREQGLGQVLVNPALLAERQPQLQPAPADAAHAGGAPAAAPRPDHPLIDWLEGQRGPARALSTDALNAFEQELRACIRRARRLNGLRPDQPCGPSPSQWGTVFSRASECPAGELVDTWLFEPAKGHPAARNSSKGWGDVCDIESPPDGGAAESVTVLAWFRRRIAAHPAQAVALMARRAREMGVDTRGSEEQGHD